MSHKTHKTLTALIAAALISTSFGAQASESLAQMIAGQAQSAQGQIRGDMQRNLDGALRPMLPQAPTAQAAAEPNTTAGLRKVVCPVRQATVGKPSATYAC